MSANGWTDVIGRTLSQDANVHDVDFFDPDVNHSDVDNDTYRFDPTAGFFSPNVAISYYAGHGYNTPSGSGGAGYDYYSCNYDSDCPAAYLPSEAIRSARSAKRDRSPARSRLSGAELPWPGRLPLRLGRCGVRCTRRARTTATRSSGAPPRRYATASLRSPGTGRPRRMGARTWWSFTRASKRNAGAVAAGDAEYLCRPPPPRDDEPNVERHEVAGGSGDLGNRFARQASNPDSSVGDDFVASIGTVTAGADARRRTRTPSTRREDTTRAGATQ